MAKDRYSSMTDEELKELAKQRNKKTGCFKRTAMIAQHELWKRNHWDIEQDRVDEDRDILDVQYNG